MITLRRFWAPIAAVIFLVLIVVAYFLTAGRNTSARRILNRSVKRELIRFRTKGAETTQRLAELDELHRAEEARISEAGARARAKAVVDLQRRRGPGPRQLPMWLLVIGCCTPSQAPAQIAPHIDYKAVALAEVPSAEGSAHDFAIEEAGPCAPGTGRWVLDGRSGCWPCPPFEIYAEGAGDLPEGCPAPAPGVWTSLDAFNTHTADIAGLRAQVRTAEEVVSKIQARETRCLEQLEQVAADAADALEPCTELSEAPEGHSSWTVAGAAVVGAAVMVLTAPWWN